MRFVVLVVLALVAASCGAPAVTTTSTPPATSTASMVTVTTSAATTTTAPAAERHVAPYFLMDTTGEVTGPGPFLVPVDRAVKGEATVASALDALLAGPTADERSATPPISSAIPEGTELLGVTVDGNTATIDLSEEFASGGGSFSVMARLAQLVYTATRFEEVDQVTLHLDGEPVEVFSSEGLVLDQPLTRDGYVDVLPMIFLDVPAYGGELGNPARLQGVAAVFEATFWGTIVDADGEVLAEPPYLMTDNGVGWGVFDQTIPYDVEEPQWGAVILWDYSMETGEQTNVREYPVWLVPADS